MPHLGLPHELSAEPLMHELQMWVPQMADHVLFAYLGVERADLKQKALDAMPAWNAMKERVASMSPADAVAIARRVEPMLMELRAYKTQLIDAADQMWIGWLYPSFLLHVRNELDFFAGNLNRLLRGNPPNALGDLCFFLRMSYEHAAFGSGLLDPNLSIPQIAAAHEVHHGIQNLHSQVCSAMGPQMQVLTLQMQGRQAAQDAQALFLNPSVASAKSVINPQLLAHVQREQAEFAYQMSRI